MRKKIAIIFAILLVIWGWYAINRIRLKCWWSLTRNYEKYVEIMDIVKDEFWTPSDEYQSTYVTIFSDGYISKRQVNRNIEGATYSNGKLLISTEVEEKYEDTGNLDVILKEQVSKVIEYQELDDAIYELYTNKPKTIRIVFDEEGNVAAMFPVGSERYYTNSEESGRYENSLSYQVTYMSPQFNREKFLEHWIRLYEDSLWKKGWSMWSSSMSVG